MLRAALRLWPILGALAVGTPVTACGHECKAYAAFGLVVTVRTAGGSLVCNAKVTAIDGNYSEVLQANGGDPSHCNYFGATERKGTYDLHVAVDGSTTTTKGVRVAANECHVVPATPTITISLPT